MRVVYILKGREMKNSNYWGHNKPIPKSFYNSSTGLKPLDYTLNKVNKTAYAHHIERLMILGNFSLLAGINPQDIFRWFMEMFIDSYEWVMVPNVIAMSQYAENTVTTKPYISSSSYIKRMSDYKKGYWSDIWDALFWNFINENREKITEIPRMKVILYNYDKISEEKKKKYREKAQAFLTKLS
jgi:deoxyribodipyrimidine photolyase-related protein